MKSSRSLFGLSGLALLLALAFAGSAWAQGGPIIRLSWKIKGEFAPFYVALEKGYFKQEGLDVAVEEGAGAKPALQTVVAGKDQFTYVSALDLAKAVDQDVPVRMVANYVKRLPMGVAAHPGVALKTPKDLEGKRLAASPGDSFLAILPTFAKVNNVDLKKVEIVNVTWGVRVPSFMKGETQLVSIYFTNDLPLLEAKMGKKLSTLAAYEWGYDVLGHGLVASNAYIGANADAIRRVVRATGKGFADTLKDPDGAAAILAKRFSAVLSKDVVARQVRTNNEFLASAASKGKPLGWNARADWERTISTFLRTGDLKQKKPFSAYYTNEYVSAE